MSALFGREQEKAQLSQLLNSGKAEFIAVYGRRRVGKTFLIKEHLRQANALHLRLEEKNMQYGRGEEII